MIHTLSDSFVEVLIDYVRSTELLEEILNFFRLSCERAVDWSQFVVILYMNICTIVHQNFGTIQMVFQHSKMQRSVSIHVLFVNINIVS